MATAVGVSLPKAKVSIEEYLNTGYRPDVEYLYGELKEKTVVTPAHGQVQILLGVWFHERRKEWAIRCAVEVRTRVDSDRVRLPDFAVFVSTNREKLALTQPPLIAIEVLSPSDVYRDLKARASDLEAMGVRNIWLIDPELRTAEVWRNGSWQIEHDTQLRAIESAMFVDLEWLWQNLDEEY